MPTYPFLHIDAFTARPLAGNPCVVIMEADDLDEATMQALAREMNLAETAFVRRSTVAEVAARYFTPAEEIPLAGHPTLCVAQALIETGRLALTAETIHFTLELKAGVIGVDVQRQTDGLHRIVMTQKKPLFLNTHSAAEVMPLFGLTADDRLPEVPIQTVSTGTPQLMIPVRDLETLRRAQMNITAYDAYKARSDFFSPHLFALQGVEHGRTFARQFGSPPDLPEDPFTGSATGGMAAYLWRYGLIETPTFIAEQGHWMHRPGEAWVEVVGPRDAIETVKVGGMAVTVMRGELRL